MRKCPECSSMHYELTIERVINREYRNGKVISQYSEPGFCPYTELRCLECGHKWGDNDEHSLKKR